jgi:hypothetical protein
MRNESSDCTRVVRHLVRLHQREPAGFQASLLQGGTVCIRGPAAAAYYPQPAWISKFVRHLHQGYYDSRAWVPATDEARR